MTHHDHDLEKDLRERFRAARRADAEGVPPFPAMTRRSSAVSTTPVSLRRLALVGSTAALVATAIAVASVWLVAPPASVGPEDLRIAQRRSAARSPEPVDETATTTVASNREESERERGSTAAPSPPKARAVAPPPPPMPLPAPSGGPTVAADLRQVEPEPIVGVGDRATPRPGEDIRAYNETVPTTSDVARLESLGYVGSKHKFSDEFVQDLPVPGRVYQNVVTLAPGAQDADGDGDPNVHGSRDRDFKALVTGISNVDPLSGQQVSPVTQDFIVERVTVTSRAGHRAQGGFASTVLARPDPRMGEEPGNTESYQPFDENELLAVTENPLSTFSIDVDTASYSNVRRFLVGGQLPPRAAVRIEELINYFRYDYPAPAGDAPFSASVEVADCPWNPEHRLARIGLKGREIQRGAHAGSNLVFLLDVSGSMNEPAKLPLLKSALSLLVEQLTSRDQVAIVVYAGSSGLALPPTSGAARAEILDAIERLEAGGSTNGGAGIELAYRIARENFVAGGVNRVILATDGDFNVGLTDRGELLRRIEDDARKGIFLTALGFGYGNLKDDRLEHLADRGNGNYAYIDRLSEARKVLVEEITGTLVTIAKDVKIQVEFNPLEVGAYRLIGYENRMLKKEDFNDDRKDAGEIGAGHTVTALYELAPPRRARDLPSSVDPLKYQSAAAPTRAAEGGELFTLRLRYKDPEGDESRLLSFPVVDEGLGLEAASKDFRFAAAVAEFGLLLRGSSLAPAASFDSAEKLASESLDADEHGLRGELLDLLRAARALSTGAARR